LRHQIEERYFGSASPNTPPQVRGWTKANTSFG
jgi:hypothetical protein